MKFQIVTPERVVLAEEIDQITLTTEDGEITVLPHHIPLVTNLKPGELHYVKGGEDFAVAISGGFGVVKDDGTVVVLADTAEHAHEIDVKRAEEAKVRAEQLMAEPRRQEDVNFAALQMQLEKALVRLKVGNKYRKIK